MFGQVWRKYLPVIALILKRSATAEQALQLNETDFRRASGGRKVRLGFSDLKIKNGRIENAITHSPMAREFGELLAEEEKTRSLIKQRSFEISLTNTFTLLIKDTTAASESNTSALTTE
jgi:hypothetical protein